MMSYFILYTKLQLKSRKLCSSPIIRAYNCLDLLCYNIIIYMKMTLLRSLKKYMAVNLKLVKMRNPL